MSMVPGYTYKILYDRNISITFKIWGDKDGIMDAVEIIESDADEFPAGTFVAYSVLTNILHKDIILISQ